ncbi:unnamed protein product [Ixodes pacificus]
MRRADGRFTRFAPLVTAFGGKDAVAHSNALKRECTYGPLYNCGRLVSSLLPGVFPTARVRAAVARDGAVCLCLRVEYMSGWKPSWRQREDNWIHTLPAGRIHPGASAMRAPCSPVVVVCTVLSLSLSS